MINMKSVNFGNLVACLAEKYHSDDNIPMNTAEITRFVDPMYFDGKEIVIITAEDEDMEDLMTMIEDDDPVAATSYASLMHRIAVEVVTAVTKNHLIEVITGDYYSGESLVDFYKRGEPEFDHEVWEHAVREAKARVITMLGR